MGGAWDETFGFGQPLLSAGHCQSFCWSGCFSGEAASAPPPARDARLQPPQIIEQPELRAISAEIKFLPEIFGVFPFLAAQHAGKPFRHLLSPRPLRDKERA
jgi:hypothetical protein